MRINDVVFVETTQIYQDVTQTAGNHQSGFGTGWKSSQQQGTSIPVNQAQTWRGQVAPGKVTTPVPSNPNAPDAGGKYPIYRALMIGDNAAGHAISLPVELRDGGVLDFGFSLAA